MLPRNAVKLLILLIVCLSLSCDVGAGSPDRRSRSRSPSPITSWARTALRLGSGSASSGTVTRTSSNVAGTSSNVAGTSSNVASTSRGGGRASRGGGRASRGRGRPPQDGARASQSLLPQRSLPPPVEWVQLPLVTEYDIQYDERLRQNHQFNGQSLTNNQISKMKDTLRNKTVSYTKDVCNREDLRPGNFLCSEALVDFQKIPRDLRGPCAEAYAGFCHYWPWEAAQKWRCSFFIKTGEAIDVSGHRVLTGSVHKLEDCVGEQTPKEKRPVPRVERVLTVYHTPGE